MYLPALERQYLNTLSLTNKNSPLSACNTDVGSPKPSLLMIKNGTVLFAPRNGPPSKNIQRVGLQFPLKYQVLGS
jgi:hypothetical protein